MIDLQSVTTQLYRYLWSTDLASLPTWKALLLQSLRTLYVVFRDIIDGQLTLRAMSLVYTTLLSLVPLIAVSFSVLKAFGVHNRVEPLLLNFLEPLGERGVEITNQIIGFVDNVQVGVLGSLGIGLLIYTVISMIQKVEASFNYTWRVECSRSFVKRFSNYLSVIIIGPVLIFSALGIAATLMSTAIVQMIVAIEPFGSLYRSISMMIPSLLVIAAFTFTYIFIPNTQVRLLPALLGGVIGGLLWLLTGRLFTTFIAASTNYTAIYSGFAIVLVSMIWLYLSWLTMLIGASIAFYVQHPEYLLPGHREIHLSNRMKEKLALIVLTLIGYHYYHNRPPLTLDELSHRLNASAYEINKLLEMFVQKHLLSRTDSDPPAYLPAQPLETTTIKTALDIVRSGHEDASFKLPQNRVSGEIETIMKNLDQSAEETLSGKTLKDLATTESETVVSSLEAFQHSQNIPK